MPIRVYFEIKLGLSHTCGLVYIANTVLEVIFRLPTPRVKSLLLTNSHKTITYLWPAT